MSNLFLGIVLLLLGVIFLIINILKNNNRVNKDIRPTGQSVIIQAYIISIILIILGLISIIKNV